jgi:hypothetical protein
MIVMPLLTWITDAAIININIFIEDLKGFWGFGVLGF